MYVSVVWTFRNTRHLCTRIKFSFQLVLVGEKVVVVRNSVRGAPKFSRIEQKKPVKFENP